MQKRLLTIVSLVGIGVLGRLIPHFPNSTPTTAIIIAASRQLGRAWAIAIPLITLLLTDLWIGLYDWRVLLSVYASFALIGLLSIATRARTGAVSTTLLALSAAVLFYLTTNFAVWAFSEWYEKSATGLLSCYMLGLPFFASMLIGDLVYTAAIVIVPARLGYLRRVAHRIRERLGNRSLFGGGANSIERFTSADH